MTERHPRIHFQDSDGKGKAIQKDSGIYGGRGLPSPIETRNSSVASVADLFAEDKIALHLPEYARATYEGILPISVREEYNLGLARVMRWKGQPEGRMVDPNFRENDLNHVTELLDWYNEIERNYPLLWQETCDGDRAKGMDLLAMLVMHDAGEVPERVGDLDRAHPDFYTAKGKRHKRKEALAAKLMIKKYLPERADELIHLYERFDKRLPEDKLTMLGHTLDKGQAGQKAAMHIIPFNLGRDSYDLANHFRATVGAFLEWANHLAGHLSEGGKKQLGNLLTDKIMSKFDLLCDPSVEKFQKVIRSEFKNVFPD